MKRFQIRPQPSMSSLRPRNSNFSVVKVLLGPTGQNRSFGALMIINGTSSECSNCSFFFGGGKGKPGGGGSVALINTFGNMAERIATRRSVLEWGTTAHSAQFQRRKSLSLSSSKSDLFYSPMATTVRLYEMLEVDVRGGDDW